MTLTEAAKWFDEEYVRLSTWRGHIEGTDAKALEGQLGSLAETCALLRSMEGRSKKPRHTKPWNPAVGLKRLRRRKKTT